jgi:hypothetical protein
MTHADNDLRPTLEGTLSDFPLAELLGLLAATRQTGMLQVSVRPAALLTIVDGRVAFASTDPSFTVRDLLVAGGLVDALRWQEAVSSSVEVGELGEALVAAGADRIEIQHAIIEQVVRVCEALVDQPVARFRFHRQPRSSMGEDFCCPVSLVRDRLAVRTEEWARLRTVVPSATAVVTVRQALPEAWDHVVIDRADWPVFLAIAGSTTPGALDALTGLGIFETTRAVARLWEAGAVVVDGRAASLPGAPFAVLEPALDAPAGREARPATAPVRTAAVDDAGEPADGDERVPAGFSSF